VRAVDVLEVDGHDDDAEKLLSSLENFAKNVNQQHSIMEEKKRPKFSLHFFPSFRSRALTTETGHLKNQRPEIGSLRVVQTSSGTGNGWEGQAGMVVYYAGLCIFVVLVLWFPGLIMSYWVRGRLDRHVMMYV